MAPKPCVSAIHGPKCNSQHEKLRKQFNKKEIHFCTQTWGQLSLVSSCGARCKQSFLVFLILFLMFSMKRLEHCEERFYIHVNLHFLCFFTRNVMHREISCFHFSILCKEYCIEQFSCCFDKEHCLEVFVMLSMKALGFLCGVLSKIY